VKNKKISKEKLNTVSLQLATLFGLKTIYTMYKGSEEEINKEERSIKSGK
jgi:hypothetical protein